MWKWRFMWPTRRPMCEMLGRLVTMKSRRSDVIWLMVWNIFVSIYWEESSQLAFIFCRGVEITNQWYLAVPGRGIPWWSARMEAWGEMLNELVPIFHRSLIFAWQCGTPKWEVLGECPRQHRLQSYVMLIHETSMIVRGWHSMAKTLGVSTRWCPPSHKWLIWSHKP